MSSDTPTRGRPRAEDGGGRDFPRNVISGATVDESASRKEPAVRAQDADVALGKPVRRGRVQAVLTPQLATLVERPPAGNWIYEIKFDGHRLLARIRKGEVRLFTRNGSDWSSRLPRLQKALSALHIDDSWLDGEIVVLNEHGLPDFQALQNALERGHNSNIIYYLFDAPFWNGRDLRGEALEMRRDVLQQALAAQPQRLLRFSEALDAEPAQILARACEMSLDGVIGKRAGSHYASRRSSSWIKLKCRQRQEFVIVGYTQPRGARNGFGALLLAINEEAGLRYAGLVGTGFSVASLQQLHEQLQHIERKTPPLVERAHLPAARGVHWVEPTLVAFVDFAEWTRAGLVRQASFLGLRDDKPVATIVREEAAAVAAAQKARRNNRVVVAGVAISHPQRVIDKTSGTNKEMLARFYESIAARLLPQLDHRPVSLLRAPEGLDGERFFQKHAERLAIPNIRHLDETLDPGHAPLMEIDSVEALVGAVQMGSIELQTWNATSDVIEAPDRFVLDLDPDPTLPWRSVIEATKLILSVLDELGLDAWLKTSGGKGMHIVVPLARHHEWREVKSFARAISQFMARRLPDRFTATMGPNNRIGKIFIDYLRNSRGGSTVAAYSVRALPGLPVSVPIARDELDELSGSGHWTIDTLLQRLDGLKKNPWDGYCHRQRITYAAWERIGGEPP